jgi:hypothetical protein
LNTVAVNLNDRAPFASLADTNLPAAERLACDGLIREGAEADRQGNLTAAADQWAGLLPGTATNRVAGGWAPQAFCERRLGSTDWNRLAVLADVLRRLGEPPFVGRLNHTQQVAVVRSRLHEVRRGETREAAAQAREVYLEALRATTGKGNP